MAFIVEDATGLTDAESYISVDDFKAYHKNRGNSITLGGTEIEQKLRLAAEYIDIRWGKYVPGLPIAEDQALRFPTDYFITDPASLPKALIRANAEYGFFAFSNDLFIDNNRTNGPGIKLLKEKVGPIETETEWSGSGAGAVGAKYPIVTKADALMRQITIGSDQGGVIR